MTSRAERILAAGSAALTLALVAYLAWQAVATPKEATPTVRVVGVTEGSGGDRLVEVRLENGSGTGLLEATVEVRCKEPPVEVAFRNVPARGQRSATVSCPAGSGEPEVALVWWTPA